MKDISILKEEILNLIDYNFNKTLKELNSLLDLNLEENDVIFVKVKMDKSNVDNLNKFKHELTKLVKIKYNFSGIKIEIIDEFMDSLEENNKNKTYILVESGKGGVGKSSVCANLAFSFSRLGKKVGIIDADIYGASIPNILKKEDVSIMGLQNGKIFPATINDIEYISTSYFTEGKPLMWRGPMLGKMLGHFINDTLWSDDIEYMFVDLPPGTGDVMIDLKNLIPNSNVIIVTTPNHNASDIAVKAGIGALQMNQNLLGVIENMSYYLNPINKEKDYIFGTGGGLEVANILDTKFLGEIPIVKHDGTYIYDSNTYAGMAFDEISKRIIDLLKKN